MNGESYRRIDRLRDWKDGDPIKAVLASECNADNPQVFSFEQAEATNPRALFEARQKAMGRTKRTSYTTDNEYAFVKSCLAWYRQDGETKQTDLPSFLNEQEVQLPDFTK